MPNIGETRTSQQIWGGRNRHKFIWVSCEKCGKERWVLLVEGLPGNRWCNACAVRKPRKGRVLECLICFKEFYVCPSGITLKKYCSKECANKGLIKGKILVCKVCASEYYRPPSQVKLRGSSFCSNKCKGQYARTLKGEKSRCWQGGKSSIYRRLRSGVEFAEWRDKVFKRDNYTCQDCGARSGKNNHLELHPHHVKSFTRYPALRFDLSNGLTLCEECHKLHTAWQRVKGTNKV